MREDNRDLFSFLFTIGLPYGNENFVYGWIDTIDGNYPAPMNWEGMLTRTYLPFLIMLFAASRYLHPTSPAIFMLVLVGY